MSVLLPATASALCELSEADIAHGARGIPEGVIAPIDPGGVRRALAGHGIEVGGVYYGEAFQNWGGSRTAVSMTACSSST